MKTEVYDLNIPAADGNAGVARYCGDLRDACVYVHGGGTFEFKVQVKVAAKGAISATAKSPANPAEAQTADDWLDLKASITANGFVPLSDQTTGARLTITHVRIFRVTIGSGSPKAALSGRNTRTH